MIDRLARCALLIVLLGFTSIPLAQAHAIIVDSVPAVNATVAANSQPVMLRFNSRIDKGRSVVKLIGPADQSRTLPLIDTDKTDTLETTAGNLVAGNYRIRWQVLSVDGHITRGDIPFIVTLPTP